MLQMKHILVRARKIDSIGARIDLISGCFLGSPYTTNPLVGSADTPEKFTASLDAFDCVTYVETALAASQARSSQEFDRYLKRIRYQSGQVQWAKRNHYITNWVRNNQREGFLRQLSLDSRQTAKRRTLSVVPGLPPQVQAFKCLPKRLLPSVAAKLRTGDVICFASTRSHLDVFHCGFIIRKGDRIRLRHSSRSQGGVVEQELSEFVRNNRMAGVIVARPVERGNS
jgi:hypothetical protein